MTKDLKSKAIKIKGKDYVQVKDRIAYLDENFSGKYSIDSEYDYYPERKLWVVKATLKLDGQEYVGLAQEVESDNYREVNATSALENCQTSAIGRAIALINVGVIDGLASANEMHKAINRAEYMQYPKPPTRQERLDNQTPLAEAKGALVKEFFDKGVSDFKDQKKFIKTILDKETVDTVEEAELVRDSLIKD